MPERAQITSIEAIDSFRASLILYLAKARAVLEEIDDEKQHTKAWLENDRRAYWEREYRRRCRVLEEAQQELFGAKLSRIRTQSAAQVLAVERAKRAVREAEEKREFIRRWSREFDNRVEPLAKQLDLLHTFLTTDLAKAAVYLGNILKALEAYATGGLDTGRGETGPPPPPATDTEPAIGGSVAADCVEEPSIPRETAS